MPALIAIAIGGALGAVSRYAIASAIYAWLGRGFPTGTLVVNVLGSLLMGFLWVAMAERLDANSALRAGLTVGLLGAFTTFSTFSLETLALMQNGEFAKAGLNVALSVVLCILGCALGMMLARVTFA
ncbi:MAG: fluoride efflux transporter CrcB [Pseudomonadota bacterium]